MIGKFVYLHYLRQRDILSNSRLEQWGVDPEHIFTRLTTFTDLVQNVDEWLNGSVFPISANKIKEFGADRLRKMASVFRGEEAMSGQLPLFDIYDFSFIPIETLSVIYEQFLHSTLRPSGKSEGKVKGAYYTPVPLVNYMLDKLDSRKPLQAGMRVLDLSCGSGAFLVQCYRKLIERRLQELGRHLRPAELGRILTNHIFGVDIDEDACQIAELSLALTLLEYVDPPQHGRDPVHRLGPAVHRDLRARRQRKPLQRHPELLGQVDRRDDPPALGLRHRAQRLGRIAEQGDPQHALGVAGGEVADRAHDDAGVIGGRRTGHRDQLSVLVKVVLDERPHRLSRAGGPRSPA